MRPDGVVSIAPLLDDDPGLLQAAEDLLIEAFVAQFSVEGLAVSVLPWATRLDVERLRSQPCEPASYDPGCHLRPIVRTNVLRNALGQHHISQRFDDAKAVDAAGDPDGQTLASELVDQGQKPDPTTIMGLGFDEIVAPDMIAMGRSEPDARPIVEP